ncbi:MAG: translation elongation factor 4 [Candidatus Pacebacteria bacterium]|nr:translation elongation factor 4 [Candidatus Paceibacterota bacterium]
MIKNFVIISHIDHGKSTLADRLLEITGTIEKGKMKPQLLDSMDLEKEKGITIKMKPVRMEYMGNVLNLIDTPGHIDFNYEVSRSLAAVDGAILLVDATKGVQAQTISNLELAKKEGLVIIPAVNKIDAPLAETEEVKKEIAEVLKIDPSEVLGISAKTGENVEELLKRVIERVPSAEEKSEKPLRALIFDSAYDSFLGIVAYVKVEEGSLKAFEKISFVNSRFSSASKEVGMFKPQMVSKSELKAGEIGYIATGIKDPEKEHIGDTITKQGFSVEALPGYNPANSKIFVSLYPSDQSDFEVLKEGLQKLTLNDSSLFFQPQTYQVLGRGFLCGFLGNLHAEITIERLKREYGIELVIGAPQVKYKGITGKGEEVDIMNPTVWQESFKEVQEPWADLKLIIGQKYLGNVFDLFKETDGSHIDSRPFGKDRYLIEYEVPMREIIGTFYDSLLNITQGYASMTYTEIGYLIADLVKLEILINGEKEEAFSKIVPKSKAYDEARKLTKKLKEVLPAQLFNLAIQGKIGGKIIARETISAQRKDVTAPLYGGDVTRKKKLLEKQKKNKDKLREKTRVRVPADVFLKIFGS